MICYTLLILLTARNVFCTEIGSGSLATNVTNITIGEKSCTNKQIIVPIYLIYLHALFCLLADCPTTVIDRETLSISVANLTKRAFEHICLTESNSTDCWIAGNGSYWFPTCFNRVGRLMCRVTGLNSSFKCVQRNNTLVTYDSIHWCSPTLIYKTRKAYSFIACFNSMHFQKSNH